MSITVEQRARIRQLFFAEHWKVGTIATELGLHHDTVRNALETHRFDSRRPNRPSVLDPYKPVITAALEAHPRLRATRLFEMVRSRGYTGSVVVVRRYVRTVRPAPQAEAYLRMSTLPGEQGQVDWASFGYPLHEDRSGVTPDARDRARDGERGDVGEAGGGVAEERADGGRLRGEPRLRREHAAVVGLGAAAA